MKNQKHLAAVCLSVLSALSVSAQTYTVVDLAPTSAFSIANGISASGAAGCTAASISLGAARATLWDGASTIDLHPAFLDDAVNGVSGRSSAQGAAGNLQVGWGAGPTTTNRAVPLAWRGTAASATKLAIPFANGGGQALGTDGSQIVGYGLGMNRDGTAFSAYHAIVWNAATGAATDLGDGGNSAQAYGVGGGVQVGYVVKSLANATLWRGTSKSLVSLHPVNAINSVAYATDGARQVGYAGYDVRVRVEAVKGQKTARYNYAMVWTGTAASAVNIHPYPFQHSYATAINGNWIAGYAADPSAISTPAYYHAIVWDANYQATDLNSFLPTGFIGSQALSVDANGNVAGYMMAADGTRHAVVWVLNGQ